MKMDRRVSFISTVYQVLENRTIEFTITPLLGSLPPTCLRAACRYVLTQRPSCRELKTLYFSTPFTAARFTSISLAPHSASFAHRAPNIKAHRLQLARCAISSPDDEFVRYQGFASPTCEHPWPMQTSSTSRMITYHLCTLSESESVVIVSQILASS
jgi:hypothetical protein